MCGSVRAGLISVAFGCVIVRNSRAGKKVVDSVLVHRVSFGKLSDKLNNAAIVCIKNN